MTKKRKICRIIGVFMTLCLTFGICLVSALNNKVEASSDNQPVAVYTLNAGHYEPASFEPNFTNVNSNLLIVADFYIIDANTEDIIQFKSMYVSIEGGVKTLYFNPSKTYVASQALKIGDNIASDWYNPATINVISDVKLSSYNEFYFLNLNWPGSVSEKYQISGIYEFNEGYIYNTFGRTLTDEVFELKGYFQTPMGLTAQFLQTEFGITGLRDKTYYISSFNEMILDSYDSGFEYIQFNCFIPAANTWKPIDVFNMTDNTFASYTTRVVIFDNQYINPDLYDFLNTNGTFGGLFYEPDEYTPTDLLFAIVDVPIRYIQSLMSFEILGYQFFIIFGSIITISIGMWIIFRKGS